MFQEKCIRLLQLQCAQILSPQFCWYCNFFFFFSSTGVNLALIALRNDGEMQKILRKYFHDMNCATPPVSNLTLYEVAIYPDKLKFLTKTLLFRWTNALRN